MATFMETINNNVLSRWVFPALLAISGFALIGHIFLMTTSSISVINSVMVMLGTVLVSVAILLSPVDDNETSPVSAQIFSLNKSDNGASQEASEKSERQAA